MTWRHYVGNDKYHFFKNKMIQRAWYDLCHDDRATLRINKERYLIVLNDRSLFKMFFSPLDTIQIVKEKIDKLEDKIKNNYLYL